MGIWADDIKKHFASIDWLLVVAVFLSMIYGYILVMSATNFMSDSVQFRILLVPIAASVIGIACMFILSKSDYDHMTKYWKYLYIFNIIVLILTFLVGKGDETGNRNWIRIPIGGTTVGIQPSEIVKITFILTFSRHLDQIKNKINSIKNIILLGLHFAVIFGLIVILQGDLGTGLVFVFMFLAMCFTAGVSLWYFLAGIFAIVAASPLAWNFMSENQRNRIIFGFTPELDAANVGFQAYTSRRAIGSGGLFGAGYGKGYYTQRDILPQQWTDFIFSAAGEEFGFIGAMLVLLLLTFIVIRIFIISKNARNTLGSLICVGVMSIFVSQTIENIGMCLGRLPVVGITLPFFSYGGSSILGSLLGIGLVLSVNSRKNIYYFTRDENLDKF